MAVQQEDKERYKTGRLLECLNDFDARTADELSFRKGDVLIQLDDSTASTLYARHTQNRFQEGFVPSDYVSVHIIQEAEETGRLLECLYDFNAKEADELSFRKGDVLVQLDDLSVSRLYARHTQNRLQEGFVPSDYVSVHIIQEENCEKAEGTGRLLECHYDFDAREADELSFRKGDVLVQLDDSNAPWLYARHTNNRFQEGLVPNNYVSVHILPKGDCEKAKGISIPDELENDPHTRLLYERAVKDGTEVDNNIRVMVIGCHSQGKTCLVRRLLAQTLADVEITNGIQVKQCISRKSVIWQEDAIEDPKDDSIKRLAKIAASHEANNAGMKKHESKRPPLMKTIPEKALPLEIHGTAGEPTHGIKKVGVHIPHTGKDEKDRKKDRDVSKIKVGHPNVMHNQHDIVRPFSKTITYAHLDKFKAELRKTSMSNSSDEATDSKINIWDFGGQYIYYATHQIFHARQAVYILVFNLADGLDVRVKDNDFPRKSETNSMRDFIKFWVNSVHAFVGSEDGKKPTIILVGTHKDKLQLGSKVDDCFEEIRQMFDTSTAINHFYRKHFAISNTDFSKDEFADLRKTIIHVGRKHGKRNVPGKWIPLEEKLKDERHRKIITLSELVTLDQMNEFPVQTNNENGNEEDIKLFLKYHHARGTFCYFDDGSLSQYVVLEPQFLIDAFKCIITSDMFCNVRPTVRKCWRKLCEEAILEPVLLDEVWAKNNNGEDYMKFKELLIQFLQRFYIISEVHAYGGHFKGKGRPLGKYIVPSLLKLSAEDGIVESFIAGKKISNVSLGFVFENDTLLPTFYQKILSAVVGQWSLIRFDGKFLLFDNVVACRLQHDHAGILMLVDNRLELLVVNLCPPQGVEPYVCDMFRRFVDMVIEEELYRLQDIGNEKKHNVTQHTVRCFHRSHASKGSKETLKLTELDACKLSPCPDNRSHCIYSEKVRHDWFLCDIFKREIPKRRLTNKEYSHLSTAIGRGWQQLGIQLGLDNILLQHIEMDNRSTNMRIYYMFLNWDKKYRDGATLDVLVRAIHTLSTSVFEISWDVLRNLINGFHNYM